MFPARSRQTVRGFTFAKTRADKRWRQIIYASQGEREACLLLLAEVDLYNIWDQPSPVTYIDDTGKQRSHRFDFLVEFKNGQRAAVAVKPEERAKRLNFEATLKCIRRDLPLQFADAVFIVTEKERHPLEVQNADLLNFFRRRPDSEADATISDILARLQDEITIAELIAQTDLGARAFPAVFRAIYDGRLRANRRELINHQTPVVFAGREADEV